MLAAFFAIILIMVPVFLSARPKLYIPYVMIIGVFPLGWIGSVLTPVGLLNLDAMKLLGILFSSSLGLLISSKNIGKLVGKLWPFAIFYFFALISVAWSPDISMSFRMLMKLLSPYFMALYIYVNFNKVGPNRLINLILISGFLSILAAVFFTSIGMSDGYLGLPAQSRAVFSSHLSVVLCVAVAKYLVTKNNLYAIFSLVIVTAILAAFTRITIAAMFLSIGFITFTYIRGVAKLLLPTAGIVLFFSLFLGVDAFKERMFTYQADEISISELLSSPSKVVGAVSGTGRFDAWSLAIEELFVPHPIVGSGVGSTQYLFYGGARQDRLGVVHSEYIRIMCDLGIVGIVLYVLAWTKITFNLLGVRSGVPEYDTLILSALASSFAYLVFLATDNGLDYASQLGNYVYILVAASFASIRQAKIYFRRQRSFQLGD